VRGQCGADAQPDGGTGAGRERLAVVIGDEIEEAPQGFVVVGVGSDPSVANGDFEQVGNAVLFDRREMDEGAVYPRESRASALRSPERSSVVRQAICPLCRTARFAIVETP
jgi:hypothetical protein